MFHASKPTATTEPSLVHEHVGHEHVHEHVNPPIVETVLRYVPYPYFFLLRFNLPFSVGLQ